MNFENYRNFVAIVECGSISAASRKICIAQPALSNQIKAFEKEYDAVLLKRGPRKIELTDEGRILYKKAKNICALEDAARKEIQACTKGNRGMLRLGITQAYPDPFTSKLLLDFYDAYPDINFEIYEQSTVQIIEYLHDDIVEVGIIRTPTPVPAMLEVSIPIAEQLMVVYSRNNQWLSPDLETVPISFLEGVPLSISYGFRNKITEVCTEAGFVPNFINVCTSRSTALLYSARGNAVSIIVGSLKNDYQDDNFCCRPLEGKGLSTQRSFAILRGRELSAVAQTFLEFSSNFNKLFASSLD